MFIIKSSISCKVDINGGRETMSFAELRHLNDGIYTIGKVWHNNLLFLMYKYLIPSPVSEMLDRYEYREVIVIIDDRDLLRVRKETGENITGGQIWLRSHHIVKVKKQDSSSS